VSAVATATPRRGLAAWQVDALLLGAIVLVVFVVDYVFASRSYFFGDDIVVFESSRAHALTPHFLLSVSTAHFSPGQHLGGWLFQRIVGYDWGLTIAIFLAFHAATIVLMQRILNLLFGRVWWTFALAFVFGLSVVFLAPLWWFSSALLVFPSIAFTTASIHAYLWWNESRRWQWLAWSVVAFCAALAFYEKAMLVPIYLVLIRVLLLRTSVRAAAREWRVWLLYVAPVAIYLVLLLRRDYGSDSLAVGQIPEYLRIAAQEGFAPAVFGVVVPTNGATSGHELATYLAPIAIVAVAAFSIVRRPSAWRAWAFLVIVFLLTALMVTSRLAPYGPTIGHVTRYFAETELFVPLVLAFAFATPRTAAERASMTLRPPHGWVAVAVTVGLLGYTGLVLLGDDDSVSASGGKRVRPWVDNVRSSLADARLFDPEPALIDGPVPDAVVAAFSDPPQNFASSVVPTIDGRVRFNAVAPRMYSVRPNGTLQPVSYFAYWTAPRRPCVTTGAKGVSVRFQPPQALQGHDFWVRATYRTSPGAALGLAADLGKGYFPETIGAFPASTTTTTRVAHAYTALDQRLLVGVALGVPPHAKVCFDQVQLGWFNRA
jgi:hypothetical protein